MPPRTLPTISSTASPQNASSKRRRGAARLRQHLRFAVINLVSPRLKLNPCGFPIAVVVGLCTLTALAGMAFHFAFNSCELVNKVLDGDWSPEVYDYRELNSPVAGTYLCASQMRLTMQEHRAFMEAAGRTRRRREDRNISHGGSAMEAGAGEMATSDGSARLTSPAPPTPSRRGSPTNDPRITIVIGEVGGVVSAPAQHERVASPDYMDGEYYDYAVDELVGDYVVRSEDYDDEAEAATNDDAAETETAARDDYDMMVRGNMYPCGYPPPEACPRGETQCCCQLPDNYGSEAFSDYCCPVWTGTTRLTSATGVCKGSGAGSSPNKTSGKTTPHLASTSVAARRRPYGCHFYRMACSEYKMQHPAAAAPQRRYGAFTARYRQHPLCGEVLRGDGDNLGGRHSTLWCDDDLQCSGNFISVLYVQCTPFLEIWPLTIGYASIVVFFLLSAIYCMGWCCNAASCNQFDTTRAFTVSELMKMADELSEVEDKLEELEERQSRTQTAAS